MHELVLDWVLNKKITGYLKLQDTQSFISLKHCCSLTNWFMPFDFMDTWLNKVNERETNTYKCLYIESMEYKHAMPIKCMWNTAKDGNGGSSIPWNCYSAWVSVPLMNSTCTCAATSWFQFMSWRRKIVAQTLWIWALLLFLFYKRMRAWW